MCVFFFSIPNRVCITEMISVLKECVSPDYILLLYSDVSFVLWCLNSFEQNFDPEKYSISSIYDWLLATYTLFLLQDIATFDYVTSTTSHWNWPVSSSTPNTKKNCWSPAEDRNIATTLPQPSLNQYLPGSRTYRIKTEGTYMWVNLMHFAFN